MNMEKDIQRSNYFKKDKKYKEKYPHAQIKKRDKLYNYDSDMHSQRETFKKIAHETHMAVERGYFKMHIPDKNPKNLYNVPKINILTIPYIYYGPESKTKLEYTLEPTENNLDPQTTSIIFYKKTVIQACKIQYFTQSKPPCVLVFANAKNPGGGWLNGTQGQEESIARCSALYKACHDSPMYFINKNSKGLKGVYTDAITYCPMVPIFRDENGNYTNEIYYANFLLCPAVNVKIIKKNQQQFPNNFFNSIIPMTKRIDKILGIMSLQKQETIILGAYGCGVFGNNPMTVAQIFKDLFKNKYQNVFDNIIFAIPDENTFQIFWNVFEMDKFN